MESVQKERKDRDQVRCRYFLQPGTAPHRRRLHRGLSDAQAGHQQLQRPAGTMITGSTLETTFLADQFPNGVTLDTVIPVNATQSFTVRQLSRSATVFRSLSPNLVIPESYQMNVGFEREIAKGPGFRSKRHFQQGGTHLWRETNPNAPVLPGGLSDVNADGRVTFTDYLLGITTGPNRFYQGLPGPDTRGGSTSSPLDAAPACLRGYNELPATSTSIRRTATAVRLARQREQLPTLPYAGLLRPLTHFGRHSSHHSDRFSSNRSIRSATVVISVRCLN